MLWYLQLQHVADTRLRNKKNPLKEDETAKKKYCEVKMKKSFGRQLHVDPRLPSYFVAQKMVEELTPNLTDHSSHCCMLRLTRVSLTDAYTNTFLSW